MKTKTIAKIYTDFPEKFGLPRQSMLVQGLGGKIIFEKEYRISDALRGIEGYSHIWLLWEFSEGFASAKSDDESWSPTVRPPRLGGNTRVGVFASRSPNRPNKIGMSVVKLVKVDFNDPDGPAIYVDGIDMVSGTPILDIKPYGISDCIPDAKFGFAGSVKDDQLNVVMDDKIASVLTQDKKKTLKELLAQNPVPHYQNDPDRIYMMSFAGYEIKFKISNKTAEVIGICAEQMHKY